ncbi:MAG: hypothetical protein FJ255_11170 [Phycisphaerae bacterium]|nr:hypothetical protein [Phycisphaerae bacterium]
MFRAIAAALCLAAAASAQTPCSGVYFDDLAPNTLFTATNQPYASRGVTITTNGCQPFGGNPSVVASPSGALPNPPSPPHCLASPFGDPIGDCCVIIRFSTPQRFVRLQVASDFWNPPANTPAPALTVAAHHASGPVLISNTVSLAKLSGAIVPNPKLMWDTVQFDAGNCIISEVRVCVVRGAGGLPMTQAFYIDSIEWGSDTTPPQVALFFPAEKTCVCDGNLFVSGRLCDPEDCGPLTGTLALRPIVSGATTTPPYTTIATFTGQFCTTSVLFNGSLSPTTFPDGEYLLRFTGTNACGLTATDDRVIIIDRTPPALQVTCPTVNQIVCGNLPVLGTVSDRCTVSWTVEIAASGGPWVQVGSGATTTPGASFSGAFATIPTASFPNGNYQVRVIATDSCGHTSSHPLLRIIIDNTPPHARITSPLSCNYICESRQTQVMGFIADANLRSWRLEYRMCNGPFNTSSGAAVWTTIATGTNPVGNLGTGVPGLIALWDNCNLGRCPYILRLTAEDGCDRCPAGSGPGNITVTYQCGNLGHPSDLNGDGAIDFNDFLAFLNFFNVPCPPCP